MTLPEAPDRVADSTREEKRRATRCAMRHVPDGPDRTQVMRALFQPITRTVPLDVYEEGSPEETDAVRAFAAERGIYVAKFGPPPARVVELYRKAVAEQRGADEHSDGQG